MKYTLIFCFLVISSISALCVDSGEGLIESISMNGNYEHPYFSQKYFNASDLEQSKILILEFLQRYTNAEEFSQRKREDEGLVYRLTNALVAIAILDPHKAEEIAKSYLQYDDLYIQSAAIRILSLLGTDESTKIIWQFYQREINKITDDLIERQGSPEVSAQLFRIGYAVDDSIMGLFASRSKLAPEFIQKAANVFHEKLVRSPKDRKEFEGFLDDYKDRTVTRKRMDQDLKDNLERAMQSSRPAGSDMPSENLEKK